MSVEAWIDVGGTFTDCLVRTLEGRTLRTKVLSSSRIPITIAPLSPLSCRSTELLHDCENFWAEATIVGLDVSGQVLTSAVVASSSSDGTIHVHSPVDWAATHRFEIRPEVEAPVLAVHRLLQTPLQQSLPPLTVRLGTTRGTNALLTRNGAKVALFVTDPFEELLLIGDQTRPDLFALNIRKPAQLTQITKNIVERLDPDGNVLQPLNFTQARQQLELGRQSGCTSAAISLMHSYRNPVHELQLEAIAHEFGYDQISVSHRLASVAEYLARTQTTVLDAYLSPIIRLYFQRLCDQFGGMNRVKLLVMTSAGGLIDWRDYLGKDSILSGPAGGVVALEAIQTVQRQPIIGLDMGGTSTDVCRVGERLELQYESTKAGVRILTPTLPIETVAAGGGSICWFDGVSLRVGPQSAGALPGPACYGRGGPLTVTDLNVVSGRVPARQFPFPLDLQASYDRIDQLLEEIADVLGRWSRLRLVEGLRKLANEQMADAVRQVSIKQGVDPRQQVLVGFGGAAGQHICEIAEALGMKRIIDHADAGLLSAVGMGLAQRRLDNVLPIYKFVDQIDFASLRRQAQRSAEVLAGHLQTDSSLGASIVLVYEYHLELRYQGTDSTLTIPLGPGDIDNSIHQAEVTQAFSALHQRRFGYQQTARRVELVALRVSVQSNEQRSIRSLAMSVKNLSGTSQKNSTDNTLGSADSDYQLVERGDIEYGHGLVGPVIVLNPGSTLVIEQGWQARLNEHGLLEIDRTTIRDEKLNRFEVKDDATFDPVLRDCFSQRLSAIAAQMGLVLQQTAVSVNIKQRRDYSCAVFDSGGQLLANAPHVPVHLGAMGVTVRSIVQQFPHMQAGDTFLCNDPYCGGSHLPDLTMVQPIFDGQDSRPCLFVANRAHHADIGGIAPGSMSISADRLEQEGVIIPPLQITHGNQSAIADLEQFVNRSPYPPRNWRENAADIYAQQAACARGCQLLSEYAATIGWHNVRRYSRHLLDAGQARMERFLAHELLERTKVRLNSSLQFEDHLEDGTPIRVAITLLSPRRLQVDFAGTGPVSLTNLNANPSIVTAALLYVLRCLVDDELPLNEGVLRAVELLIPQGVLNPPSAKIRGHSPAVAAGNVETSQRVVDVLLGALGMAAASQGTMNNVLFGNKSFGFYETICGGSGATATASGASAVHTHMTNTRLTDPEILELRYPVRLVRFGVRHGSGGQGRTIGGDGIIRAFKFLQPVSLSLLTSRRAVGPFGIDGGQPGATGENWLQKSDGSMTKLASNCQIEVDAGSVLTIKTPGGGGFGQKASFPDGAVAARSSEF